MVEEDLTNVDGTKASILFVVAPRSDEFRFVLVADLGLIDMRVGAVPR